ncbi:phage tail tape measure protein [[Eubacterium] hominis]|uniref:phage tail tape measure protein n=1 Tax=[Eubacterium] hominis TaxID=2764325 RepID=UPI0022E20B11
MTGGMQLASLWTEVKVDIAGFKSDMDKISVEAKAKANEVSKQMEKTVKVGENMSKLGGTLTKTLTVPLAGAGIAATKMAVDYESSFAKVSTLLDKNVVDYDKYKNDIIEASSKSKVAVGEFSEAVYGSISAGVDQTKAIKFTTDAMKLAKGGFTDGAKAVDVMTTAINGYNLSTDDATKISDMLITTQNLGKTTVDELASSMGAVIPVASSVNFGIDELSASYAQLTKNGIATAESGTYLKSMLSELGKSGSLTDKALRELTGKGFADLKKEGKSTSEILNTLSSYAEKNGKTLKDMFGSVEAGSAAMVSAKGDGIEYNEMLDAMQKSAGATQEAFDKMDATPAEQLKGALNELKNEAIKLGSKAIPIVTEAAKFISKLVDGFTSLSPGMQDSIIKFGLLAAAAGPVLKVGGGLISTYGKLKPIISGLGTGIKQGIPLISKLVGGLGSVGSTAVTTGAGVSKLTSVVGGAGLKLMDCGGIAGKLGTALTGAATSSGGLLASLGGMAAAAAPWAIGAAAIVAGGKMIYDNLNKEVIPEVDLFKDKTTLAYDEMGHVVGSTTVKISEETQKQVQSYLNLSNQAQQESLNMYTGITKITDDSIKSINGKVSTMSKSIIDATNTQRDEVVKGYQDMFNNTTAITKKEQDEIMASVNKGYDDRVGETTKLKNELTKIYKDIADNGGKITQDQQKRIDEIYDEMKRQAVQAMADNEAEQNVILNRLSSSNERITAEMVGESIKQMNKLKDDSIKTAAEKRDALVLEAEKLKTLENGKYKEKADAIIKSANDEYDGVVKAAEKTRKDGINKLMSAHEDMADKIDISTGDIVSIWDKMFGKWDRWQPESKTATVETIHLDTFVQNGYNMALEAVKGFHANGLPYVPYDGYTARLHKGERILDPEENEAYTRNKVEGNDQTGQTINFNGNYTFSDHDDIDYFFNQAALKLKAVR